MIRRSVVASLFTAFVLAGVSATPAAAQSFRTWVSGTGLDANPCSRTQPCRTFAAALGKTKAGGEIDALDPGDFGEVSITKAITIDGGPGLAGIVQVSNAGVAVNAGSTDVVTLRNLSIQGDNINGGWGIAVFGGASVLIEHCV